MEESIADTLLKGADVMHFFGQYRLSNTMILASRLLRAHNIHRLDTLEAFVTREEEGMGA